MSLQLVILSTSEILLAVQQIKKINSKKNEKNLVCLFENKKNKKTFSDFNQIQQECNNKVWTDIIEPKIENKGY